MLQSIGIGVHHAGLIYLSSTHYAPLDRHGRGVSHPDRHRYRVHSRVGEDRKKLGKIAPTGSAWPKSHTLLVSTFFTRASQLSLF
jgi:hypothetical protein